VLGVEAVAHERLVSPAFDPLSGFETRRLRVNQRYPQNTLEQVVVFAAALFGLAAYSPDGSAMRAIVASTAVWILARFAFWIGYHRGAAMRGLGAPSMALSTIMPRSSRTCRRRGAAGSIPCYRGLFVSGDAAGGSVKSGFIT
jgi:uncharacterized MAPEG superfamily protein